MCYDLDINSSNVFLRANSWFDQKANIPYIDPIDACRFHFKPQCYVASWVYEVKLESLLYILPATELVIPTGPDTFTINNRPGGVTKIYSGDVKKKTLTQALALTVHTQKMVSHQLLKCSSFVRIYTKPFGHVNLQLCVNSMRPGDAYIRQ